MEHKRQYYMRYSEGGYSREGFVTAFSKQILEKFPAAEFSTDGEGQLDWRTENMRVYIIPQQVFWSGAFAYVSSDDPSTLDVFDKIAAEFNHAEHKRWLDRS